MSRVESLRKSRGWSRLDLAVRAAVTESTIIRAERTNPPAIQARNLDKIAHALDVPVSALLDEFEADPARPASVSPHESDVLFIHDLAYELRTTVRRLRAILKTEPWKLPERLPSIDNRDRWARVSIDRWLEYRDQDRKRRTAAALVSR